MVDSDADSRGALSSAEETELGDPTESEFETAAGPTAAAGTGTRGQAAAKTAKLCAGDKVSEIPVTLSVEKS